MPNVNINRRVMLSFSDADRITPGGLILVSESGVAFISESGNILITE
jgi:hypothetical protein